MSLDSSRSADWPRTEITVAGTSPVRLSVIDVGPTEPPGRGTIVCIHGAGGHALQWSKQIAYFSRHYRIVAPDLRGHGRSEAPDSTYKLEEFLWDFTQTLQKLAVEEPFILMAHSFGGPIAMTFAAAQPQRISRLVLVATGPEMTINPLHGAIVRLPISLGILERLRPVLMPNFYAPVFVIQRVLAGTLFRWRGGFDLLPALRMPALIIGGQWDLIVPETILRRMHGAMPSARIELVRYTGHLPHLERPSACNRLIEGFLHGRRSWRGEEETVESG